MNILVETSEGTACICGDIVYDVQNSLVEPYHVMLECEPQVTGLAKRQEKAAIKKALNSGRFLLTGHDYPARIEAGRVVARLADSVPGPEVLVEPAPVLTLHADFTIASGTTVVTGTKDLKVVSTNTGSCAALANSYDAKFVTAATYSATIDTPSGSFTDSGSATLDTERSETFQFTSTGSISLGGISRFRASFTASSGVTPGPSTAGTVVGGGVTSSGVGFGLYAKADGSGPRGTCGVFDFVHRTFVRCLTIDSFVITGSRATLTGNAIVNSVETRYRIDVTDLGEPGFRDTFKIQTDSGFTAEGSLRFGDIRIHQ